MSQMHFENILLLMLLMLYSFSNCQKPKHKGCKGLLLDDDNNPSFRGWPTDDLKIYHDLSKIYIPDRFDARIKWNFCPSIRTITTQGNCGGCWAFASSSVIADRICIGTKGTHTSLMSTQDLLECCEKCVPRKDSFLGGCNGGYARWAFKYWESEGIVTGENGCKPVDEKVLRGEPAKKCRKKCTNSRYKKTYFRDKAFASTYYVQPKPGKMGLNQIQAEIMINGPVLAFMKTFAYMLDVPKTHILYYDKRLLKINETAVAHAIKIIGWNVIDEVPVWIMANSWGSDWCNNGFCHVRRGFNDFNIEMYPVMAGTAKVTKEYYLAPGTAKVPNNSTRGTDGKSLKAFCVLIFITIISR